MSESLSPEVVESALSRLGVEMEAAECHGILCGLLCAQGSEYNGEQWMASLQISPKPGDILANESLSILEALQKETLDGLADPNCDFHLLLPDDEQGVEGRLLAVGDWCQGFLLGMSRGGREQFDALPEEAAEIVHDIAEISQVESYELGDNEGENESTYMELVEYLRTGVLLVNELLNPTKAAPITEDRVLH